jgi:hypothetical protein
MAYSKRLWIFVFLASSPILGLAQIGGPCVYNFSGEDGTLYCASNCGGAGEGTSVDTESWDGTPPTPAANRIYTYSSHSFDCGKNLTTGNACASVTYYTVEENNVGRWPTHHSISVCAPFIAALSR